MYPGFQMGMTWMTVASIIWTALAVLVVIVLVWLVVVFARVEDGGRRVLDELSRGLIDKDEYAHGLEARRTH
jgi:hypothetical protein